MLKAKDIQTYCHVVTDTFLDGFVVRTRHLEPVILVSGSARRHPRHWPPSLGLQQVEASIKRLIDLINFADVIPESC